MADFTDILLRDSPDALIVTDLDGRVLKWSGGATGLFGYTPEEAEGHSLHDLIVPANRHEEEDRLLREVLDKGNTAHESIRRRKDGSFLFAGISARVVRNDDEECIVSNEMDITDLKAGRDARMASNRFGDPLQFTPDGIVMVNATGRIILANSRAEEMFGYDKNELIGQPVEMLLPEALRESHIRHRSGYMAEPRVRTMGVGLELYGCRRDGREIPVEISLSPLKMEAGMMVMSAIRDISERKRFEQALQEKNIELVAANKAKDHFLASMSHELRTPLNAILGFTGTLLMQLPGSLNEDQKKQLETVRTSARHLLSLINDLLDLTKIESGKTELYFENLDCREMIKETVEGLKPQANEKGLALSVSLPEKALNIQTDKRALSQILMNLLSNAIKFTESGSISVTARRTRKCKTPGLKIIIQDSGIGIRPEDQGKLFVAFSQIHNEQSAPGEGTGLGLYLSQRLAGYLGGRIELESEYGKGSTFSLILEGKK